VCLYCGFGDIDNRTFLLKEIKIKNFTEQEYYDNAINKLEEVAFYHYKTLLPKLLLEFAVITDEEVEYINEDRPVSPS
jgi:hypothetical protein